MRTGAHDLRTAVPPQPGEPPVPGAATFLGVVLGALGVLCALVAAAVAQDDARHVLLVGYLVMAVLRTGQVAAAQRLRHRDAWAAPALQGFAALDLVAALLAGLTDRTDAFVASPVGLLLHLRLSVLASGAIVGAVGVVLAGLVVLERRGQRRDLDLLPSGPAGDVPAGSYPGAHA